MYFLEFLGYAKNVNFHDSITSSPGHFTAPIAHKGTDMDKIEVTCLVAANWFLAWSGGGLV